MRDVSDCPYLRFARLKAGVRSSAPLFAVKPLLIIYMMSWAVTNSVGTELWLYKGRSQLIPPGKSP